MSTTGGEQPAAASGIVAAAGIGANASIAAATAALQ